MKTRMESRSLGEQKGTYSNTNSSIRQMRQEEESKQYGGNKATSTGSGVGTVVGLLAGAGVGVLAGVLMAPQRGEITRRRVADSASWLSRGITEAFSSGKSKVNSWTSKGKSINKSPYKEDNKPGNITGRNKMDESGNREL